MANNHLKQVGRCRARDAEMAQKQPLTPAAPAIPTDTAPVGLETHFLQNTFWWVVSPDPRHCPAQPGREAGSSACSQLGEPLGPGLGGRWLARCFGAWGLLGDTSLVSQAQGEHTGMAPQPSGPAGALQPCEHTVRTTVALPLTLGKCRP